MSKIADALLVVDVQNFFAVELASDLPKKIVHHIENTDYSHLLFTQMYGDDSSNFKKILNWHGPRKSPDVDIHPLVAPLTTPETTFKKITYSAFKAEGLREYMTSRQIRSVDVCGINIDACVLGSAFDAFDLGLDVRVLEDLSSVSSSRQEYIDAAKVILNRNFKQK